MGVGRSGYTAIYRLKRLVIACLAIFAILTLGNIFRSTSSSPKTNRQIVDKVSNKQPEWTNSTTYKDNPSPHVKGSQNNKEVRHIAFLKVHKAGSSTIQNILYRFGVEKGLSFVLPRKGHYLSKTKYNYTTVLPLPKAKHGRPKKYDILCNHVVFNSDKFEQFLYPDAEYFAIVRRPLDLFLSAAYYYRDVWPMPYITNLDQSTFIHTLLQHPEKYESDDLAVSRTFNYMTRDFGFVLESVNTVKTTSEAQFQDFLDKISNIFKLVLVMERFDESLVLLKRRFRWSMQDIMYLKNNVYQGHASRITNRNLTKSDLVAFNTSQWMDIKLYNHFSKRFEEQVLLEKNFAEEVQCLKAYLSTVKVYCSTGGGKKPDHIVLPKTRFSESFTVTKGQCQLMALEELRFYRQLVLRHKEKFAH